MEEVLPPWASLTTWVGLIVLVVLALFKRWLVPKSHHEQVVGQLEARLADRDALIAELRRENTALDERNDLLANQIYQLVSSGVATTSGIARPLPRTTRDSPSGDQGGAGGTQASRGKVARNPRAKRRSKPARERLG